MKLHTMWALRDGEASPELIVAWDALSVAHDPEGWKRACLSGQEEMGFELEAWREIELEVSEILILDTFRPALIGVVFPEAIVQLVPPDALEPPLAVAQTL